MTVIGGRAVVAAAWFVAIVGWTLVLTADQGPGALLIALIGQGVLFGLMIASVALAPGTWRPAILTTWMVGSMPALAATGATWFTAAGTAIGTLAAVAAALAAIPRAGTPTTWEPLRLGFASVLLLAVALLGSPLVAAAAVLIIYLLTSEPHARWYLLIAASASIVLLGAAWFTADPLADGAVGLVQAPLALLSTYSAITGPSVVLLGALVTVPMAIAYWGSLALGLGRVGLAKAIALSVWTAAALIAAAGAPLGSPAAIGERMAYALLLLALALAPVDERPALPGSRPQWWIVGGAVVIGNAMALRDVVDVLSAGGAGGSWPRAVCALVGSLAALTAMVVIITRLPTSADRTPSAPPPRAASPSAV